MSRAEYMREYRKRRNDSEKMKDKIRNDKLHNLKDELIKTHSENSWFDSNRNFYLNPILLNDLPKWNEEREKRFNLEYDIEHIDEKIIISKRKEAYRLFCQEKDLLDRCEKWRLFSHSIYHRKKRFPTKMECINNNTFKPDLNNRPDLLQLFKIKEDDPLIYVTTAEDWAEEDNFLYDLEKMGISEDEYYEFLGSRNSTFETREEFLLQL